MRERDIIKKNLQGYFEKNENKKVVILPVRNRSDMVKEILQDEYGIKEQFIVDNFMYDMKHIYPVDRMPDSYKECAFLMAAIGDVKKELEYSLKKYVSQEQIVDLLFSKEREEVFQSESKVHLDFLCVGFSKCGTSSLQSALEENPRIYLPKVKETFFLHFAVNKASHERFKNWYGDEKTNGKIIGGIEPTYHSVAEDVYRYFGKNKDFKIIFCVRNPADALYSDFKMIMRGIVNMEAKYVKEVELMKEFGRVCPEMFDHWNSDYRYRYEYAKYINDYLKYYPIEQIKVVVFEELRSNPYEQMNDLQNFLNIPNAEKLDYCRFPRENVGDKVVKDVRALKMNMELCQLRTLLQEKCDSQTVGMLQNIYNQVQEITLMDYKEPMLLSTWQNIMEYYSGGIHELEKLMGRSLRGVWY